MYKSTWTAPGEPPSKSQVQGNIQTQTLPAVLIFLNLCP